MLIKYVFPLVKLMFFLIQTLNFFVRKILELICAKQNHHFVIWYQNHFKPILTSVCVEPIVSPAIGPPIIYSLTHKLIISA